MESLYQQNVNMKKLLGIIVLGLLLSGCETTDPTVSYKDTNYSNDGNSFIGRNRDTLRKGISKIEFCQKELPSSFFGGGCRQHSIYFQNNVEIHYYDNKRYAVFEDVKIPIRGGMSTSIKSIDHWGDGKFVALVYSMNEAQNIINKLQTTQSNAASVVNIEFTIKDKKEQCTAIGFKPATEKFADCVLRLVELDVKSQQSTQIALAQSQGNQQVVTQLQNQNNSRSSDAFINFGLKLLSPQSTVSAPTTTNCRVIGSGAYKTVNCW
jgi:hypothetical protein